MTQWLAQHATILVPIVVALGSAFVGTFIGAVSPLRRGLRADLEILNAAAEPGEGHAALAATIDDRKAELAARVQFPIVTLHDVARIATLSLGAVAIVVLFGWSLAGDQSPLPVAWIPLFGGLVAAFLLFVGWWSTTSTWHARQRERRRLLREAGAGESAGFSLRLLCTVGWASFGWLVVTAPPIAALAFHPSMLDTAALTVTVFFFVSTAVIGAVAARGPWKADLPRRTNHHSSRGKRRAA